MLRAAIGVGSHAIEIEASEQLRHPPPVGEKCCVLTPADQFRLFLSSGKCEEAAHSLTIVLAGNVGTRRRLMRNGRNERRTCIICGTEEVGTLVTGFLPRFLFRKAVWKFEILKRDAARTFSDPEWYLETCSIVRNFSFSTDVVLQHAFPHRVHFSC
jgi:hypothetical protein